MVLDLALLVIFLGSFAVIWRRLSFKLPELIAIPDQVITQRLHEDSAKLRLFIIHLKSFYKDGHYKTFFWKFLGRTLYKSHIVLLKMDNWAVLALKKTRYADTANGDNGKEYWNKLKDEQPKSDVPISKSSRIQEVRTKR